MPSVVITVAQSAPLPDDLPGNAAAIREAREAAARMQARLVVCPQDALTGRPAAGIALRADLLANCTKLVEQFVHETADGGPALLFTAPRQTSEGLADVVILAQDGAVAGWRARHRLEPEEIATLVAGPVPGPLPLRLDEGRVLRLGVVHGIDIETPDVSEALAESGAELLISVIASSFDPAAPDILLNNVVSRIRETGLACLVANLAGALDDRVHAGGSFALDADCRLRASTLPLAADHLATSWAIEPDGIRLLEGRVRFPPPPGVLRSQALCQRLRAMVRERKFDGILLRAGEPRLAALAIDAVGPSKVRIIDLDEALVPLIAGLTRTLESTLHAAPPKIRVEDSLRLLALRLAAETANCLLVGAGGYDPFGASESGWPRAT
ncbi:nitrilase-related carbon-nitrogen hydrolase [Arboricoccus pini]|uniref:nitrilase-related carbon-nitrogen hydrolase n=1 Tax=Arboricoccus pini TaxID=1963835 RepID=UPI0013FD7439|nr:nitrilase-related carbon-nitrogen hydrolase [Arboricoccus pini]